MMENEIMGRKERVCILGTIQLPLPKPHITSFKDLFDFEGCVMLTLVDENLTNKPMGPKIISEHP